MVDRSGAIASFSDKIPLLPDLAVPSLPSVKITPPDLHLDKVKSAASSAFHPFKYIYNKSLSGYNHFVRFLESNLDGIKTVVTIKGLAEVALAPMHVISIAKNAMHFHQQTTEQKVDSALDIASDIKDVGESSMSFIGALEDVKLVNVLSGAWFKPFSAVMSALSIASMISNVRTCYKVKKLMKQIKQAEDQGKVAGELTFASYQNVVALLDKRGKEEDFISSMFNADHEKFSSALVNIEFDASMKLASDNASERSEGQEMLEKTMKALKGKLKKKIVSSAVCVTASVITLIGTAILLASPLSPIGWAVLGIAAVTDISRWIHHKVVEYKFAKSINMQRSAMEWALA